jgi:hypothetical protein
MEIATTAMSTVSERIKSVTERVEAVMRVGLFFWI